MKATILSILGVVGSFIAWLFGGWDTSIIVLLIFMLLDFISGIVLAGVFHKSKKSQSGSLESKAGWKGLIRKCMTIFMVIGANLLDQQLGTTYIRDGVCIAYICNEAISLVENAGLMGLPLPAVITNAIELLKNKEPKDQDK